MATGDAVRARLDTWPYEPDVAHVVLLDHHMVPSDHDIATWVSQAHATWPHLLGIRTGAMFPEASARFAANGFAIIDTLALLDIRLDKRLDSTPARRTDRADRRRSGATMRKMRTTDLPVVAELDRAAFGDPWGNDVRSLRDITTATPRHRGRVVVGTNGIEAMAISGQSGAFGYIQRLAVAPDAQRQGHARRLVVDALRWIERRGATTAMVNTGVDNVAALTLYQQLGFSRRSETLHILERQLDS